MKSMYHYLWYWSSWIEVQRRISVRNGKTAFRKSAWNSSITWCPVDISISTALPYHQNTSYVPFSEGSIVGPLQIAVREVQIYILALHFIYHVYRMQYRVPTGLHNPLWRKCTNSKVALSCSECNKRLESVAYCIYSINRQECTPHSTCNTSKTQIIGAMKYSWITTAHWVLWQHREI